MDKKILILKNDRVGDLFHSLKNIEGLRNFFSEYKTDLYLSNVNFRFAKLIDHKNLNVKKVNLNLTIIDKTKLLFNLIVNKYSFIFILSPKSFYFFLPFIFRKTKFLAICVDGNIRKRPNNFLRKYLYKYVVNDRSANISKKPIYELENELINLVADIKSQKNINKIFNFDKLINKRLNVHFHYKATIFGEIKLNLNAFNDYFIKLVDDYDINLKVSTDLEMEILNQDLPTKILDNHPNIEFLGPIDSDGLLQTIIESDLVISPHGAISCIAGYFNKNIIDIFDRNITRNAFNEFKPYTEGYYQFIFKSKQIYKTQIKISNKINNLINKINTLP